MVNYPNLEFIKRLVDHLRDLNDESTEDIPPFETRYPDRLESILEQIQSEIFGRELYPGLTTKAARLFYLMNKGHPFLNGNKRIATATLYFFLKANLKEFKANRFLSEVELMALNTSISKPENEENIMAYLKRKIRSFKGRENSAHSNRKYPPFRR